MGVVFLDIYAGFTVLAGAAISITGLTTGRMGLIAAGIGIMAFLVLPELP